MFHTLERWSPSLRAGFRLAWVMCWGIPLHAWDAKNITKIENGIGEVMDVDEDVRELHKLDRARVLIKIPWLHVINHIVTTFINGVAHTVKIVEEICCGSHRCNYNRGDYRESSEEISSE